MRHIIGSVLTPLHGGRPFIIAHVVNTSGVMGAGVAKALSDRWPQVREVYMRQPLGLGKVSWARVFSASIPGLVANMYAQTYGRHRFPLSLPHLEDCLREVELTAQRDGLGVHIPRVGAGLARGHWPDIALLIPDSWTCYTLPDELAAFPVEAYENQVGMG